MVSGQSAKSSNEEPMNAMMKKYIFKFFRQHIGMFQIPRKKVMSDE
jgi:hypothetical protein